MLLAYTAKILAVEILTIGVIMSDDKKENSVSRNEGNLVFHCGMIVTWDLTNNLISGSDLKKKMDDAGYPQNLIDQVPCVDIIQTVKKVSDKFRRGRGRALDKYKGEVVDENDDKIVIGILKRILSKNGSIDKSEAAWEQVDTLMFNKHTTGWDENGITGEAALLRQSIDKALLGLDGEKVRRYVVENVVSGCSPLSLRGRGGVLYVPMKFEKEILMVKNCLATVGNNRLNLYYITGQSDIIHDVQKNIKAQVSKMREQLESWKGGDRKVRSDAEENFFSKIVQMKDNLQIYAESMKTDLHDIEEVVAELKAEADKVLDEQAKASEFNILDEEDSFEEGPGDAEGIVEFQFRIIRQLMKFSEEKRKEVLGELEDSFDGYMAYALKRFSA